MNKPINIGELIFHKLCSKIGTANLVYPRFISLILITILGDRYHSEGEKMDASYISRCIFSQLASKNANAERPLTSGMISFISSSNRPSKPCSRGTTKRKEP